MKKHFFALGVLTFLTLSPLQAQQGKQWTLRQCIDHALANNISLQQQELQRQQQEIRLSTARNRRLPSLNASAGQNFSFGRGLTMDNTYTNTSTQSTSFSLGTDIPLFTGFEIPNSIAQSQLDLKAATEDLAKARNSMSVNVAQAYMQVLYSREIQGVAQSQVAIDSQQVARMKALVDNGKASAAQLSAQQASLSQSLLTLTQAENNLRLNRLTLTQLLELPSPEGFDVAAPDGELSTEQLLPQPDDIFAQAMQTRPEVKAEQYRLEGTEKSIKIAQSGHYPQLSLNAGLGSNYYKTNGMRAESFGAQLRHNFNQYVGLSLSIPIFNRFSTRNSVRSARANRTAQQLQLDDTKKQLYKEIQQAYYNAVNAQEKFRATRAAVQSANDAFTLMTAKYENSKANITEFNESKNQLMKAESDRVQAQYEYLYSLKLLDFYRGQPF